MDGDVFVYGTRRYTKDGEEVTEDLFGSIRKDSPEDQDLQLFTVSKTMRLVQIENGQLELVDAALRENAVIIVDRPMDQEIVFNETKEADDGLSYVTFHKIARSSFDQIIYTGQ